MIALKTSNWITDLEKLTDILPDARAVNRAYSSVRNLNAENVSAFIEPTYRALKELAQKENLTLKQQQKLFFTAMELFAIGVTQDKSLLLSGNTLVMMAANSLKDKLVALTNLFGKAVLQQDSEYRKKGSILNMDFNGFKAVNDTYGHKAGDDALQYFSGILTHVAGQFEKHDIDLYRTGGDEFIVVIEGDNKQELAKAFKQAVNNEITTRPFRWKKRNPFLEASIGIASYNSNTKFADAMATADQRMYTEKKRLKAQREETLRLNA